MKTIKLFAVILTIALTAVSCVENSEKYKTLLSEKDSLQSEASKLQAGYNETIDILNGVEEGFSAIRANEQKMTMNMQGIEGSSSTKKQQLLAQIGQIKDILDANRKKIQKLQEISAKYGKQNTALLETIKRMETELNEKNALITSLQNELGQKNIHIQHLDSTITGLNKNVADLNEISNQQMNTIKTQDHSINSVWYCVETAKNLKKAQIVMSNGLFKANSVLAGNTFDGSKFKEADLRKLSVISTESEKIKILSVHPKGSYTLEKGTDNKITIHITSPEKFWSVSRYLVVQK